MTVTAAEYRKHLAAGTLHLLAREGHVKGSLKLLDKLVANIDASEKRGKRAQPERALQREIAKYLDGLPGCGEDFRWFHVPNERRDAREAMRLAGEGVKAGVPDVVIVFAATADGPARLVFVEVKAEKGSLSKSQADWREWCKWSGVRWHLVRSVDEVRAVMEER